MAVHEEAGAPQPLPGEGVQETPVRRFDRPAALADRVVVMAVRQSEEGGAANVDLLDEPRVPHAFEDAIGRDEAESGRSPLRALPDTLTGGEMASGGQRFEDGDALRRHAESGAAEEAVETIAGQPCTSVRIVSALPLSICL